MVARGDRKAAFIISLLRIIYRLYRGTVLIFIVQCAMTIAYCTALVFMRTKHWSLVCTGVLVVWCTGHLCVLVHCALVTARAESKVSEQHHPFFAQCVIFCTLHWSLCNVCCAGVVLCTGGHCKEQVHPSSYLLSNPIRSKATGVIGLLESISDHLENISESFLLFLLTLEFQTSKKAGS